MHATPAPTVHDRHHFPAYAPPGTRTAARLLALLALTAATEGVHAQAPTTTCDASGIGAAQLTADGPRVSILSVSRETMGAVSYCLVKVLVPQAINIWGRLPMGGAWNGRWQSVVGWVERGAAPKRIVAAKPLDGGGTRTRPLCPYPSQARYSGQGSTDEAASFVCSEPGRD